MTIRYKLSFTSGRLFLSEAPIVCSRYLELGDWGKTRERIAVENLLQARTTATAKRFSHELTARLECLTIAELHTLLEVNLRDRAYLLWSAVCRQYKFIQEFAIEVVRESYILRRNQINKSDWDRFYNSKALWHPELDAIAPSTQEKLRQNVFHMLREAGLLSPRNELQPAILTPALAQLLAQRGPEQLLIFPATDLDIQRWLA